METVTKPNEEQTNAYLQDALSYYTYLAPKFDERLPHQYWVLGCIFDSIIDFLSLAAPKDIVPHNDAVVFLFNTAKTYLDRHSQGEWYDDWCWWGNAAAKVFLSEYDNILHADGTLRDNLTEIATQTFVFAKTGVAPYTPVPDNDYYTGTMNAYTNALHEATRQNTDGGKWALLVHDCAPVWNIGCWQGPMIPDGIGAGGHDPRKATLGAFQDSVMNGLFYVLAQRTLDQPGTNGVKLGTQTEVDDMTAFYSHWMGHRHPALPTGQQLFIRITETAGLFRERVSIYSNGKPLEGFSEDLAWTGDQGLMLNALTELYKTESGAEQQDTLNLIKAVIKGVCEYAVGNIAGSTNHSNVIMPWCHVTLPAEAQPGNPPGWCDCDYINADAYDYFSGTGIFMRGLLEATGITEITDFIRGDSAIQEALNNTISALQDGDAYKNITMANYTDPSRAEEVDFFNHFNKMATLITASQLL